MICALVGNLTDLYLEGRLVAFQASWVRSHLAVCGRCAEGAAAWRGLAQSLRALPAPKAPQGLKELLRAAAAGRRALPARRSPLPELRWSEPAPSLALAFSFLALLVSFSTRGPGSQSLSEDSRYSVSR